MNRVTAGRTESQHGKSRKQLEHAIHNKKYSGAEKEVRWSGKERSHRLIVKGQSLKSISIIQRFGTGNVQDVMDQLQNSSYNKSIVRQVHIASLHKEQQQITEAVEKTEKER